MPRIRQSSVGFRIEILGILFFDRLCIPSRQANKYQNAGDGYDELDHRRAKKDINETGNHDTDQAHDQERPELGKIALGGVTIKACCTEHRCRNEERARDTVSGKDQEDRCHGQTHDRTECPEHQLC